ncbi:cyclodeaminase/cyclohydrolase family protein [Haloferula sp. BvORR071]|uniref:cyclodeaminase/cyclohydrolase family protein n=1 Tax=Haloferula sp. BvORR071 TaxID=1396141 RepID=UPI00069742F3|nr:cyclodeaminase/cyclohydrolase family protein [Haloferula sp. BvORR071]
MPVETEVKQIELLALTTGDLLERFGSGGHKPGSGSGAALVGVLSAKFIITVISLTLEREAYQAAWAELQFLRDRIIKAHEPRLKELVQLDADQFDRVVRARQTRDAKPGERRLRDTALEELRIATDFPIEIAEISVELGRIASRVFDVGFKSARGDSGLAISAAISAASSALFITFLNLKSFRSGDWAVITKLKADNLLREVLDLQSEQFRRVTRLQVETSEANQLELQL